MFISARMKKIQLLTLASDEPKVTESIGMMGVLHLTKSSVEIGSPEVTSYNLAESEEKLESLIKRTDALCESLGINRERQLESIPHASIYEIETHIAEIEKAVGVPLSEKQKINASRAQVEKLLRDTAILQGIDAPIEQLEHMSFLHFAFGSMPESEAKEADKELLEKAVILPYKTPYGENKVIAVTSKKGRWTMESALEKHGFHHEAIPSDVKGIPAQTAKLAEERLAALLDQAQRVNQNIRDLAAAHETKLIQMRQRLDIELKLMHAREKFSRTWATMLITGWLPSEKVGCLRKKVDELTVGKVIFEVNDPAPTDEADPPTLMKNHWLIRPFELLIQNYSLPRYNEIEPTPIMALLFPILFGLMFGDVGHSGILLLAGIFLWIKFTGKARDAGVIITFCGISGILFGIFYGSIFGLEKLNGRDFGFFHPLENVQKLLLIAIVFGAAVITIGILLNIINRFRRHEFMEAWFDRFGVIGGLFYWSTLALAALGITKRQVPEYELIILIILPLIAIGLHKPIETYVRKLKGEKTGESVIIALFEGLLESFDTVLAYTANTLSFARVGAFALAHAALSIAIFELIKVVKELPGGAVWTVFIFAGGTVLIIFLEGLIVVIQSLRLEYYEFLAKFYRGEGRKYEPFSLK